MEPGQRKEKTYDPMRHTHRFTSYLLDLKKSWPYESGKLPGRSKQERAHYWKNEKDDPLSDPVGSCRILSDPVGILVQGTKFPVRSSG